MVLFHLTTITNPYSVFIPVFWEAAWLFDLHRIKISSNRLLSVVKCFCNKRRDFAQLPIVTNRGLVDEENIVILNSCQVSHGFFVKIQCNQNVTSRESSLLEAFEIIINHKK